MSGIQTCGVSGVLGLSVFSDTLNALRPTSAISGFPRVMSIILGKNSHVTSKSILIPPPPRVTD